MSFPAFRNHVGLPKILRTNNHFGRREPLTLPFFRLNLVSLCLLCVLCVSVVNSPAKTVTTEAQSTQRFHREVTLKLFAGEMPAIPALANQENS